MSHVCSVCVKRRKPHLLARIKRMKPSARLAAIKLIIETVDNRCMAVDGPVPQTLDEMNQREIAEIYRLAGGRAHD